MIKKDLLKYAWENIKHRKLRSWLTIISVIIGIAAITALMSFGNGISSYVTDISQKMGKDKLIIQPRGFGFGQSLESNVRLNDDDRKTVEDVNGIQEATGIYIMSGQVEFNKQKKYVAVFGSDYKEHAALVNEVYTLKLEEGNNLKGDEKGKAILGYNYKLKDKIFSKPIKLRDKIMVNGKEVEVIGFYEEFGNPQDDSNIFMTDTAVQEDFNQKNFQFIIARAAPGKIPADLVEPIKEKLRKHRHQKVGSEDFFVQTFEQVIETFNKILSIITGAVILIAFISIFVAAVNIMNTMYTSILERTKEIGVFKAIGSSNSDILIIFIFESAALSLMGGGLGVALGYGISQTAGKVIASSGYAIFTPIFTWNLVAGALLFACLIGIIAGLVPAYQASKLKPVDALRYE